MDENADFVDALIAANARLAGLEIAPESLPVVRENLEVAMRMAAMLESAEVGEREDPAPVFRA